MKKQRIAFISDHASPMAQAGGIDSGGQNIYVRELAIELSQKGFDIDVFTRKDSYALPAVLHWLPGVRVIHIQAGPEHFVPKEELMPYMDEFADNMIAFMQREKISYDLVHANFWMSGMVAMLLKERLDIPFVITFHALGLVRSLHQKESDKFPKERIPVEHEIIQQAGCIVAECPQDAEDLQTLYGADKDKMVIIPCGFNPEEFFPIHKQEARKHLQLPPDGNILLQLGRIVPRKGIDNVIRALKYLPAALRPVHLLIVGGDQDSEHGPCAAELRRLAAIAREEGVMEDVTFTGPRQHEELKYYYSAADIFISTPWYEPFGITPLESMACGTPVIGSDVGGIKFTVVHGETGFLVPPKAPAALAEKISCLLGDPLLAGRMGAAAVKRVNHYFTWKKIARQMQVAYNALIQKSMVAIPVNAAHSAVEIGKARALKVTPAGPGGGKRWIAGNTAK